MQNFYSRPCGRGDFAVRRLAFLGGIFLLTPLREGRHLRPVFFRRAKYFYSRPCGRGDILANERYAGRYISTHAPAGGATVLRDGGNVVAVISTHAPAGGATVVVLNGVLLLCAISTHAPAGGATVDVHHRPQSKAFLLTPLREGRLAGMAYTRRSLEFLLTPLREGRPDRFQRARRN